MNSIDYNRYLLSSKERQKFLSVTIAAGFVFLYLFYDTWLVIFPAAAAAFYGQRLYAEKKIEARREFLAVQFRDLLYSLSASIGAGRHMGEALIEAGENLSLLYEADTPMMTELAQMRQRISAAGESEERLLYDLAARSNMRDIGTFAEVYSICRESGGDLVRVIGVTSQMLLDKLTIQQDIRSYTAQKRFEGKVIGIIPTIILLFLRVTAPDYLIPLYTGAEGRALMTIALILVLFGFWSSDRMMNIGIWENGTDETLFQRAKRKKEKTGRTEKHSIRASGFYKSSGSSSECGNGRDAGGAEDCTGRGKRFVFLQAAPRNRKKDADVE